jgi:hypothetical protein
MLRYDNVPMEINRLRCRVNYHALKFLPDIEEMADKLAARMRNRTGNMNPYMYVINYPFCWMIVCTVELVSVQDIIQLRWS